MAQVSVKYNPYRMDTQIVVNGSEISDDNLLQYVKGKRLQEWVSGFPEQLADALNSGSFDVEFCGTALDYDDFLEAFKQAGRDKVVRMVNISFKEGKTDTDINQKIVDVFTKLQEGPVDEFRDPQLKKAFDNINSAVFPINIIGTMSAGKSTLINALLGRKLMPAQNGACTDKITEILDNDNDQFHALVYDADNQVLEEYHDLTYEIMVELNKKENVRGIRAEGDIPFLTADDTALKLIDTPGTNNSENRKHRNTTYRALENSSNSLVIYILNSTQLETDDDNMLLNYVAEQIRKGGKRVRDRFLFVINKIDAVNPDEGENPQKMMQAVVEYLARHGIENPQIFPCSAIAALVLETELKDVQFDTLSREEKKALSASAKKAIPVLELFNDEDCMHMEKYTTLCPSAQSELEYRLQKAEADEDANEQALIHSGICSLEAAITAYVKKYAKTKKIKDLVESFEQILDSTQVLTKAKSQVAADEAVAKACAERAAAVRAKIDGGEEAQAFKKKVAAIDPVPEIEKAAKEKQAQIIEKITMLFSPYGKMIRDKEIAQGLIHQFANESTELIAQMTVDLESLIDQKVVSVGTELLNQYQEKLLRIDESAVDENDQLDFSTVDMIKGALNSMREAAEEQNSEGYATGTLDDLGETTYENREWYEKVGVEEEQVFDHNEQVKIGTKKVESGTHVEKIGTRTVKNDHKKWFKPWTWLESKYLEQNVYQNVADYKDEDVYTTRAVFKTVTRDVFEKRTETIEKYEVLVTDLMAGLLAPLTDELDTGIANAMDYAKTQVDLTKEQFARMFDKLDELIKEKYEELEAASADKDAKDEILEKNRALLNWIEECKNAIDDALNI